MTQHDPAKSDKGESDLAALISRAVTGRGLPPVETWNPDHCGDIDMRIAADGTWFYQGTPIGRERLVRLFSTVLRKDEDGQTYLVTPVEKVVVHVEDAPFLAVEMSATMRDGHEVLTFRTNVGDLVEAGPEHPIRFEATEPDGALKPYLHVRGRLEALVTRALTYDLVERAVTEDVDGKATVCLRSAGAVFPIMPADDLAAG
ncbi:hypothetical protein GCM10007908_08340 [Rhizobium albus]|nr:hypothetical protein GCM10007908_08340 [Rhizobium albus]